MKIMFRLLAGLVLVLLLATGGFIAWSWAPDLPVEELKARWGQESWGNGRNAGIESRGT